MHWEYNGQIYRYVKSENDRLCFGSRRSRAGESVERGGSHQFRDRVALLQDGDRPAGAVVEFVAGVDSEALVDRRQQAVAVHRPVARLLAARVGAADDLAHLQPAARQENAHRPRPVVAAGAAAWVLVGDARGAAELAAEDEQYVP